MTHGAKAAFAICSNCTTDPGFPEGSYGAHLMHTRHGRQDAVNEGRLRGAAQPVYIQLRPRTAAAFCRFVTCSSTGRGRSSQSATGAVQAVHHMQAHRAMRDAITGHAPMMTTSNSSSVEQASLSHVDARLVGLLLHPTAFVLLWASQ
jgi:hypothetical protein